MVLQPELLQLGVQRAHVEHELQPRFLVIDQRGGHGVLRGDLRILRLHHVAHLSAARLLQKGRAFDAAVGDIKSVGLNLVVLAALVQRPNASLDVVFECIECEREELRSSAFERKPAWAR